MLADHLQKTDIMQKFNETGDLAGLKTKMDKLNVDKLKAAPADLCKLSNIVKRNVNKTVIKTVHDKLIEKSVLLILNAKR